MAAKLSDIDPLKQKVSEQSQLMNTETQGDSPGKRRVPTSFQDRVEAYINRGTHGTIGEGGAKIVTDLVAGRILYNNVRLALARNPLDGEKAHINTELTRAPLTKDRRLVFDWDGGFDITTMEGTQAFNMQFASMLLDKGYIASDADNEEIHDYVSRVNIYSIGDGEFLVYHKSSGKFLTSRGLPVKVSFNEELGSPGLINNRIRQRDERKAVNPLTPDELILAAFDYKGREDRFLDLPRNAWRMLSGRVTGRGDADSSLITTAEIVAGSGGLHLGDEDELYVQGAVASWFNSVIRNTVGTTIADVLTPGQYNPMMDWITAGMDKKVLLSIQSPIAADLARRSQELQDFVNANVGGGVLPATVGRYISTTVAGIIRDTFISVHADEFLESGSITMNDGPDSVRKLEEQKSLIDQDTLNEFALHMDRDEAHELLEAIENAGMKTLNPIFKLNNAYEIQQLAMGETNIEELKEQYNVGEGSSQSKFRIMVPRTQGMSESQVRSEIEERMETEATRPLSKAEILWGHKFVTADIVKAFDNAKVGEETFIAGDPFIANGQGMMELFGMLQKQLLNGNNFNVSISAEKGKPRTVRIARVVDGDTVVTHNGETIRFLGIDTPETAKNWRSTHAQPGAYAAMAVTMSLLDGNTANIELNPGNDRYGRTLASLSVGGVSVEETLLGFGLANILMINGLGTEYGREEIKAYHEAQRDAKSRGVGMHSDSPTQIRYTNQDFFLSYHVKSASALMSKNDNLKSFGDFVRSDGDIETMMIVATEDVPGYPGQSFLIPRHNPSTGEIESIEDSIERAMPLINEGKLLPYRDMDSAEKHRVELNELVNNERSAIIGSYAKFYGKDVSQSKLNNLRKMTMHWSEFVLAKSLEDFYSVNKYALPTFRELDGIRKGGLIPVIDRRTAFQKRKDAEFQAKAKRRAESDAKKKKAREEQAARREAARREQAKKLLDRGRK